MEQGYSYHSMEISYNRFERMIELPGDLSKPSTVWKRETDCCWCE